MTEINFWHHKWQLNDIGFDQASPNIWLKKFMPTFKLPKGSTIFVPLCGKSIDMLWLFEQGYHVIGVEVNPLACETFFKTHKIKYQEDTLEYFTVFSSQCKKLTLYCGDFFDLKPNYLAHIDLIYDRAALIALNTKQRVRYAQQLGNITKNQDILLITMEYDQNQMPGPPFSVSEAEVRHLFGTHYQISKQYKKEVIPIAEHMRQKGLKSAHEVVFKIETCVLNYKSS